MKINEVVVTGPDQVSLEEADLDRGSLKADQLLIRNQTTFISTGTELSIYTGNEPRAFQPDQWCTFPFRPGYASVGIVEGAGSAVERTAVGDRIFSYARHASHVLYSTDRLVIPVPDDVPSHIAAASRMAGVALTALLVSDLSANPTVAVFGLGPVGNLAAQSFNIRGCRVIGIDPVAGRRDLARRCGIETVVGGDPSEVEERVLSLTAGTGAEITIDAVGHSSVIVQALGVTARYGQLILLGTPRQPVLGDLTDLLSNIHLRFITLRGALEWQLPIYSDAGRQVSQFEKQEMIFDWLDRGLLEIEPLISHRLPASEIGRAYEGLRREPQTYTGVALEWGDL